MTKTKIYIVPALAIVLLFCNQLLFNQPALADPAKLAWSIVDTPANGQIYNTIASPSEVNLFTVASDGMTLYSIDIPNRRAYKSSDSGATWPSDQEMTASLLSAGANLPVWNIAVAPDDPAFVAAVTDGSGMPNGPKRVFVSRNGGATWDNANLVLPAAEYISSIDISLTYGIQGGRDIAVGTRTGGGTGKVRVLKVDNWMAGWQDQSLTPAGDVVALKFSPSYVSDQTIVVIYSDAPAAIGGTFLTTGSRDMINNTTTWSGTQVEVKPISLPAGSSPDATQIITADLELPSDFVGTDPARRRYYISYDDVKLTGIDGVYRVDDTQPYHINPPTSTRISSIAYWGTYVGGKLAAGEVTTNPNLPVVYVWRCLDPISNAPSWQKSDEQKSPTGGANSGYANAQLAWSPSGNRLYCGTSAADLSAGGTSWIAGHWPLALLTSVALDESAFSVSPYTYYYESARISAEKPLDVDVGRIWNQSSLIDTEISFLSDVAVLDTPKKSKDYPVRYLASISDNITVPQNFDSVWRATSDQISRTWERILCTAISSNTTILRVNPRLIEEERSQVLVFAAQLTTDCRFSSDEGQSWQVLYPNIPIVDLSLASDEAMFVLGSMTIRRGEKGVVVWTWGREVDTTLGLCHAVSTPLKNPPSKHQKDQYQDWVVVGDAGQGYIAYADFSEVVPEFRPPLLQRVRVPIPGNMHVIFDEQFEQNSIIYAASNDTITGTNGKVYRWTVGKSTAWDELEPPNNAFYGICQGKSVLYGVWNTPAIPGTLPGADRTLYPRSPVPPPIEWDDLTTGLPAPPNTVQFTREPTALKLSTNEHNTLWAIDNRRYDFANSIGCLWAYTDTMSRKGPWPTAPASGDLIPVDPVSGQAEEVNFAWEQITEATVYELQIAKDEDFTIRILSSDNITPVDQTAPAVYFPAGGLSPTPASAIANWGNLESGHKYYWRVRASRAVTGEVVHSPWSATMYFTVKAGTAVTSKHVGLTLLKPGNGAKNVSLSPSFSWVPLPKATAYEIIIARDPALSQYIAKETVNGTAYEYDDILEHNTAYFWQVRAIKPAPSDPSPVATFTTIPSTDQPQAEAEKERKLPFWIWPVIGVYALLLITMIVFAATKPAYFEAAPKPEPTPKTTSAYRKIRNPFARIAEAFSPRIRRRHYLEELEEKGIIKTEDEHFETIRREGFMVRLKRTLLSRFQKKQQTDDTNSLK